MIQKIPNLQLFKARIVNTETGKDAELGEAGELLVRGPQVQILTSLYCLRFKGFSSTEEKNGTILIQLLIN